MSERFESIKNGVEEAIEWKKGIKTGARVHKYSAMDVARIRRKTKMTQKKFSEAFSIPLSTLRKWEQGQRVPHGPAQVLLRIIDKNSKAALEAMQE